MKTLDSLDFLRRVETLKTESRRNHTRTIQIKIDTALKNELFKQLKTDDITVKDLFVTAIEVYLRGSAKQ
jgi:hypothetical protein